MPIAIIRGKVWKFGDNISTDFMMPGFAQGATPQERAGYCMRANRPEFPRQVQPGDVIVGGRNFGCGSSRPAAATLGRGGAGVPWSLRALHGPRCGWMGFREDRLPALRSPFSRGLGRCDPPADPVAPPDRPLNCRS